MPLPVPGTKKMVSSGPQLAPRVTGATSHMVTGAPPRRDTFFSSRAVKNPTQSPSGEKKGKGAAIKAPSWT